MVRSLASENLGADPDGYKKEFLSLIDKAQTIMQANRPD